MMQHHYATQQFDPLPSDLDSATAKLVYFYLEAAGDATLDELNQTLSMKKISVLSVLNSLSSAGLVEKNGDRYVTVS